MNTSDFIVSIHHEFRVQGGHVLELSGVVEALDRRYRFENVAELGAILDREHERVRERARTPYADGCEHSSAA